MGRQVDFFLHPDDLVEFDHLLKSFGDVLILPYYHHDNKISTKKNTLICDIFKESFRVYLARPQDLKDIKLKYIPNFDYWLIEESTSPIIQFDTSIFRDNTIHRGRLYFEPQYFESMNLIRKSDDFIIWADKIIKTVRRKLKKHKFKMGNYEYIEYIGKKTTDWCIENKAKIAGHKLIPTNQQQNQ